ncbi:shikimate dehydrogenase family protein [Actinomycetota bacterium]
MRLAVFGDPIHHSLSPLLHNTALAASGLEGIYEARRVDIVGLAAAVDEIRAGRLDGGSVTMPHKEAAARLCDRLAATSSRAGAVNTLVRVDGHVIGHNTDIAGIQAAWRAARLPSTGPVVVLGAGGAAAAAVLALEDRDVTISSRRPEAAHDLVAKLAVTASVLPWGAPVADAVVVNATPLGMRQEPLEPARLAAAAGLFDMAYGAHETPAVGQMRGRGLPVADGRLMLLHQAAVAFELWTGRTAPFAAMQAALAAAPTTP